MKKNKLIELLNQIEGNPDILIFNGFVEDYTDFKLHRESHTLVKHSVEFFERHFTAKYYQQHGSLPNEQTAKQIRSSAQSAANYESWEFPNVFVTEDDAHAWYGNRRKEVYLLEVKQRGKNTFTRSGDIEY